MAVSTNRALKRVKIGLFGFAGFLGVLFVGDVVYSHLGMPRADFAFSSDENITAAPQKNVVVLEGDAYAVGFEHGRQLKDEIHSLRRAWLDQIFGNAWLRKVAVQRAHQMEKHIPEDLIQEMHGVADGAAAYYEDILLANTAADLVQHAMLPFGCSSLAVMPERAAQGAMLVGRNLDYPFSAALRGVWRPFVIKRPGKRAFVMISVPGLVGATTGINDRGVYVAMHTVLQLDQTADAVPNMILFREALESAVDAATAVEILTSVPRASGTNAMIADGHVAIALERRAHVHGVRQSDPAGTLTVANHYASAIRGVFDLPADWRWDRLNRHNSNNRPLELTDVRATIASAGQLGINVLATMVDYGTGRLYFGSEADPAASGHLDWVDWRSLTAAPAEVAGVQELEVPAP